MAEPTTTVKAPALQDFSVRLDTTGCAATDSDGVPSDPQSSPSTTASLPRSFSGQVVSTGQTSQPPRLTGVSEGQCIGLRGQSSTSEQVGSHGPRRDVSGVPCPESRRGTQRVRKQPLGILDFLNSPKMQALDSEKRGTPPTARPFNDEVPSATSASRPGPFSTGPSTCSPGMPVGPITPLSGPSSSALNSPTTAFPFPGANYSPQAMSFHHEPQLARDSNPSKPPCLPSPPLAQQPYGFYASEEAGSHSSGLPHNLTVVPPRLFSALPTPRGSFSQLVIPTPEAQAPPVFPPSGALGRQHPAGVPLQTSCPSNMQPSWPVVSVGPQDAPPSWPEAIQTHGTKSALFGVETQQVFMTLPGSDTPIPVQVDYSQASKKADEKRQRNAMASTRHRKKRRMMQEENTKQLQELQRQNWALETENEELTEGLAFFRGEHERLRNLILQTPPIAHLAGPSSPTPPTSNEYAEIGGLAVGTQGSLLAHGYGRDSPSGERLAQRRRMDENRDLSIPAYGSPASGHIGWYPNGLPPVQGMPDTGYGGPS